MKRTEILEKAIQKAIDGGWKGWGWTSSTELLKWRWEDDDRVFSDGEYDDYESINVEAVIFNHDFAKALWGDRNIRFKQYGVIQNAWIVHLQQMVIADDPIEYLGKHTS